MLTIIIMTNINEDFFPSSDDERDISNRLPHHRDYTSPRFEQITRTCGWTLREIDCQENDELLEREISTLEAAGNIVYIIYRGTGFAVISYKEVSADQVTTTEPISNRLPHYLAYISPENEGRLRMDGWTLREIDYSENDELLNREISTLETAGNQVITMYRFKFEGFVVIAYKKLPANQNSTDDIRAGVRGEAQANGSDVK